MLGSGAAEGTSICGCSTDGGAACFGRSAQRAPRKMTRSTARSPTTSLRAGLGATVARGPETPGICGISDLKRSDGGWSVIWLRFDSILKEEKVDNPDKAGVSLDSHRRELIDVSAHE